MQLVGYLSKQINSILNKEDMNNTTFTEEELSTITTISLSKKDLGYIDYFTNVENLNLDSFPSVTNDDIILISQKLKKVKNLKIKEQNALFNLNLSSFNNLDTLCVIHNDNLTTIGGFKSLSKFTFYDNKDFSDIKFIIDYSVNYKDTTLTFDIEYYVPFVRKLYELGLDFNILKRIMWVESIGLRKYVTYDYTSSEIEYIFKYVSSIADKYTYKTDDDIHKFTSLYNWMLNNIKFVNEDDPNGESLNLISNVNKVFSSGHGGRLSFAKAFQLLLSFVNIKSSVVYSMGATDVIGFYNGKKVCSLLGESDYALLRVTLDNKDYYCDIAWDSLVKFLGFYDNLRVFLVSKDELKIRHRLVGEGNIEKTYSYHGDDVDDLIKFAEGRYKEVTELFDDIDRMQPDIVNSQFNMALVKLQLTDCGTKVDSTQIGSQLYKDLMLEMIKLEEQIDSISADLVRFENVREGIVKSYSNILIERYLGNVDSLNKDEVLSELQKKMKIWLLSEYMYNLFKIIL